MSGINKMDMSATSTSKVVQSPPPASSGKVVGRDDSFVYSSGGATKKARLDAMLNTLLSNPILFDVPKKPSLADVETLINLELGSAMKITVIKMDGDAFDVAVLDTATVRDLKLAIKKKTDDMQQEELGHRHISWRHVWANFCLSHKNDKLIDDNALLQDFGIRNNSQVHFVGYIIARESKRHSRRRKTPFFPWSKQAVMTFK